MTVREYITALEALAKEYGDETPVAIYNDRMSEYYVAKEAPQIDKAIAIDEDGSVNLPWQSQKALGVLPVICI